MRVKRKGDVEVVDDDEVLGRSEPDEVFDSVDDAPLNSAEDQADDDDLFRENLNDGFGGEGFGGGYSPMEKHSDLLKSLTDFEPFMKVIVSEWLGMVWSEKDEKYVEDEDVEPTMNVYGARWCVNFLRVYTRDNNIITNLDKDTYADIMSDVTETVFLNIGCRAEEFGIVNDGDILKVSNQLCHSAALVLVGTGGSNNYKDLLTKSVSRNENVSYSEQTGGQRALPMPQKRGFLSSVTSYFSRK